MQNKVNCNATTRHNTHTLMQIIVLIEYMHCMRIFAGDILVPVRATNKVGEILHSDAMLKHPIYQYKSPHAQNTTDKHTQKRARERTRK